MFQIKLILIALISFGLIELSLSKTDYCKPNLCKNNKKHIACNNNGAYSKKCAKNARVLKLSKKLQQVLISKHNQLRNQIAQGKLKSYQPAKRMATMRWSTELAKLAEYNVKQCVIKHDQCRNTAKFHYAGQNAARKKWRGLKLGVAEVARAQIQSWYNEYQKCTMAIIKNLHSINKCGHFTAMVQEKNVAVGCAILRQTRNGRITQLMVCNYAYSNILRKPVYRAGKTASLCKTGANPRYKGLCSVKEIYDLRSTNF